VLRTRILKDWAGSEDLVSLSTRYLTEIKGIVAGGRALGALRLPGLVRRRPGSAERQLRRARSTTSLDGGALCAELGADHLAEMYSPATIVFATEDALCLVTRSNRDKYVEWLFNRGVEFVCVKRGSRRRRS
jgi:hypothetical protein